MELKEGDLVLCKVKKIERATVFLEIEENGEGSMMLSEVSAGRIRNLRQYVAPNKKIVCKILKKMNGHIQLSLRRVTAKERENVLEKHKKERKLAKLLETINNNSEQIINKIKESTDFVEFFEEAKESPELLKKYFSLSESTKLEKLLSERTEKEKIIKKSFTITTNSPTGISDIKEILTTNLENIKIKYLGSSKFSITIKGKNFKETNKELTEILEKIEQKAKSKKANFKLKEK